MRLWQSHHQEVAITGRALKLIVWSALVLIFVAGTFVAWEFTVDDSYITFRYSKNLAEGLGLVWNSGSTDPVEGYTNFLWMLLMVVPHAFSWPPELFAKLLGMVALLASCAILFQYTRYKMGQPRSGIAALLPMVILPSSYFHAVSGLETVLYALLLLVLFIIGLESITDREKLSSKFVMFVPAIVLLAGLTRPEGLLPGSIVLLVILISLNGIQRVRFAGYITAFLVLPGLVYFIWRYYYFGWLMPNTFYVKFGSLDVGIRWLVYKLGLIVGVLVTAALAYRCTAGFPRRFFLALYLIGFLGMALLPYSMSELMIDYMNRFLFHILPVIFLVLALSLESLFGAIEKTCEKKITYCSWHMVIIVCICILPLLHGDKREMAPLSLYDYRLANAHVLLAESLREADIPRELKTLTLGDAGAIPYFSGWQTYDFIGLTDETVAHDQPGKADYIAANNPTIMILYSIDGKKPRAHQYGFDPSQMMPDYQDVAVLRVFPGYFLQIFLRKDIPESVFANLENRIRVVSKIADVKNAAPRDIATMFNRLRKRLADVL